MKATALSLLGQRTSDPPISWLMKMTLDHPNLISLAAGFTDSQSLPVRETREMLGEMLRQARSGQAALQYGTTAGDPRLRQLTAERLQRLDADASTQHRASGSPKTLYSPDRLLLTNGSQQLLYMVTEALCDPGDIVLVEDPTYFVYLGIMQSHGLKARGIPLCGDGLDLDRLEETLRVLQRSGELARVKLLYLVSYHQNPTGTTTTFAKKQAALECLHRYEKAAGHPIYLLEDAAYRELCFAGPAFPSALAGERWADRVIYTGTYSKPFATGVRVGFGLLPEPVLTTVRRIKGNHDFGTASLLQHLLVSALATGRYEEHLAVLHRRYARKARIMMTAVQEHFPAEVQAETPAGGLYVWARLPKRVKSGPQSALFKAALQQEVLYVPGQLCYAEDPTRRKPDHEMRLSFGGATEADIREGIARLGQVLRRAVKPG